MIQEHARELERERELHAREQERLARERERERERAEREFQQTQERIARERERAAQERAAKATRLANFSAQLVTLRDQRAALQTRVDAARAALDEFRALALPDENALAESEARQNELEEREAQLRSDLTVAEELYNRAVLEAERRRAEIARLEQEIEDDLGPVELDSATPRQLRLRLVVRNRPASASAGDESETPAEASADSADAPEELITLPPVEALPDGFDKEIRRLKNQMRYIGNVNPNAPQEYAELKERHAFLTEQAADLTHAIERLHLAIQELDAMMKQKFLDTFNAINNEFRKYFTILFGGGTARLELTDPNDLIRSGIEITARPPGKRAAQLVLLSGGERALTAAALIFSILRVSPTPFCVMDEVDAALDEANVGRFRDSLKELADATQFIVITHNRVTMDGARAIYGVSMGEDGISQVLSLRLEEAAANAR
jgi:chromosome segregation protein